MGVAGWKNSTMDFCHGGKNPRAPTDEMMSYVDRRCCRDHQYRIEALGNFNLDKISRRTLVSAADEASSAGFWAHFNIVYLLTYV